jgi:hypothetical protein
MVKKSHQRTTVLIILLAIAQWLGTYLRWWTMSDVLSYVPYFIFVAMFGVLLWDLEDDIKSALGVKTPAQIAEGTEKPITNFIDHLAVHYVSDRLNPYLSRYLVDGREGRKKAYPVPTFLEAYIRQNKINCVPHKSETELKNFIKTNYSFYGNAPKAEDLDLRKLNGNYVLVRDDSALVLELRDHNLEDLQIIYLKRRRPLFWQPPARRTLLVKLSTKQAFLSPNCGAELVEKGLIASESKGMWIWQSCPRWCKCHGYHYNDWYYPESKLKNEPMRS